jgi:hypothetical protein
MKKILKILCILLCDFLIVICSLSTFVKTKNNISTPIRDVEISSQQINGESCYNAFDYYEYDLNNGILEFAGYDSFSLSDLSNLNLISDNNINDNQITTKYICNYDYENSIVSLSIAMVDGIEVEILDEIYGIICMNDDLEFDVSFDIEGEIVLLSELSNVEIVENCGFFKKIFNKVKQKVESTVSNIVDTTKNVLSKTSGKVGTILTVGVCAVAGAVCAVVPGCRVGTAIFVGMAIGYVGASTTAAVSTYQQDGKVDWNAVSIYGQIGAVVGGAVSGITYGVTTAISNAVSSSCTTGVNCFTEGTVINSINGLVAIENVNVGDYVLSSNLETNETNYKKVTKLFKNETNEWIHLSVNGEDITCTPNHPIYVENKGWIRAKNLNVGDFLVSMKYDNIVIDDIRVEKLLIPEVTYNFEVEDNHTYYVGEQSVLVHNKCTRIDYSISTGRTTPNNLSEKLAMDEIKSNPQLGSEINLKLNDPRLSDDCVKIVKYYQTSEGSFEIHYVWDKLNNVFFDFKFI